MLEKYDVICVGSGFSTSFFLHKYLKSAKKNERILILERGKKDDIYWQIENKSNSSIASEDIFVNKHHHKQWDFSPGFGGTSKRWWACTPRMLPNDFRMKTTYGVGVDWPIGYDDLEKYYCEAERIMAVAGDSNDTPFNRSEPYPQPPHLLNSADKMVKVKYPDKFFVLPNARARVATENRPQCCGHGFCLVCPVDAKFTILNEMADLYNDSRVTLLLEANVKNVEFEGERATGINYIKDGRELSVGGDLIVLGANTIFNPYLLLSSGLKHPMLGKNLHEQVSKFVTFDLDGINNYDGSTSLTGHGYMFYDGEHRRGHAGCLIETWNLPYALSLRPERGKYRQRAIMKFVFEDFGKTDNYVRICPDDPNKPEAVYTSHSDFAQKGIDKLPELVESMIRGLPVDSYKIPEKVNYTDGHITGTVRMGDDPETSVVDKHLIHHRYRNLVVLGSCVYPNCTPANPALTLSALALWSADYITGNKNV